jgi:type IV pilus assembly protein PilB
MLRKRLGDILIDENVITQEQLKKAIKYQKENNLRLGEAMVELGIVSWQDIALAISNQLSIPFIKDISVDDIEREVINKFPKRLARKYHAIPYFISDNNVLVVLTDDPLNPDLVNTLRFQTGYEISIMVAPKDQIDTVIEILYIQKEFSKNENDVVPIKTEGVKEEDAPIIRLVNSIITNGVNKNASDIHIEPKEKIAVVRFRVDGTLRNEMNIPKNLYPAIISRIKILAKMDIAEKRLPQDGKFSMSLEGEKYDLRVSTLPASNGEKIVLRILKVSYSSMSIEKLGFSSYNTKRLLNLLDRPHGIILVTGPTGSGKSTTLVAALNYLNKESVNILTVEDPVEYKIDGVSQVQVKPEIGLTFSNVLRTFLRQDPDIIMLGEIRDPETAKVAMEAALTGHLVLSTIHTNNAVGAITRLIDIGVEPFLVSSALIGVVSQRLVRILCDNCKYETTIPENYEENIKSFYPDAKFYKSKGCGTCRYTGYLGRTTIGEVLTMNGELQNAIIRRESEDEYLKIAKKSGMRTIYEDGMEKVAKGITSLEEVLRIVSKGD